jgi:hypothetical protein
LEIYIKLIEVIIWPITTITLGILFRNQLRQILQRFNKLKYKGIEADFDKELKPIENRAEILIEKTKEINLLPSNREQYYSSNNRLMEIAEVSPRAAISESWRELEIETVKLLTSLGYDSSNVQMSKIFRNILVENNYPKSFYNDYRKLRELRNKSVHANDLDINQSDAERYITTTLDIILIIQKMSSDPNLKNPNKIGE